MLRCDLMLVDGGHGYYVAMSDIRNLARVASQPNNVIIVDDINIRQVIVLCSRAFNRNDFHKSINHEIWRLII